MPLLLALETSSRQLGVAVIDGERILSSVEYLGDYTHAVELPQAVSRVLSAAGATLRALDAFIIDIGPGSFTGLRIGLAFMKALAFTSKKPVVGVSSLDVLAATAPLSDGRVAVILDARQHNLYAALFQIKAGQAQRQTDYLLGPADDILRTVASADVFLGDGCGTYRDRILQVARQALIAPPDQWWPRVGALARLGQERWLAGQRDDPATLVPMYLYPLDCSVRGPGRPTSVLPALSQPAPAS